MSFFCGGLVNVWHKAAALQCKLTLETLAKRLGEKIVSRFLLEESAQSKDKNFFEEVILKRLFFLTLLGAQLLSISATSASTDVRVKSPFPDFTLRRLFQSTRTSLVQYRGKILILDFWASWCEPCRKEFSALNDLFKKYRKSGVVVVGINVDAEETDAKKFLESNPVDFGSLHDDGNKLSNQCNFQTMPHSFILDKHGVVRFMHSGYNQDYDPFIFEKELKSLL